MANNKGQITDGDNILDFLNLKNIEDKTDWSDPITKSSTPITLDKLQPYDNNPRTTRNPKYDEIRDSIEARGLNYPPNISRRNPDDEYYIIIDGGNTRLEILQELYEKYVALAEQATSLDEKNKLAEKAQSFYSFDCVFKPWKSESDTLSGHMCENEERGETKFIEKATAVQQFREIYAREDRQALIDAGEELDEDYECPRLSTRELSRRMASQGWSISQSHLTRFEYATETLIDVIPKALWAGAGQPIVRSVRKYKKAYEDFWQQVDVPEPEQDKISKYFFDELHKFDGETFDLKAFIDFFNGYLADKLGMPVISVSAEVNALLNNKEINVPPELLQPSLNSSDAGMSEAEAIARRYQETRIPGETVTDPGPIDTPSPASKQRSTVERQAPATKPDTNNDEHSDNEQNIPVASNEPQIQSFFVPSDIDSVWQGIFDRAAIVAEQYNLMMTLIDDGSGFQQYAIMSCIPFKPERANEPRELLIFDKSKDDERAAMWWAISCISGSYKNETIADFTDSVFANIYQNYLLGFDHNIMAMILYLEEITLMLPDETQKLLYELRLLTKQYLILQKGDSHDY